MKILILLTFLASCTSTSDMDGGISIINKAQTNKMSLVKKVPTENGQQITAKKKSTASQTIVPERNEKTNKIEIKIHGEVSPKVIPSTAKTLTFKNKPIVKKYCDKVQRYYNKYKWGKSDCHDYSWHHV